VFIVAADTLAIVVGDVRLAARLETEFAPATCRAVERLLPLSAHLIHARWSGEAGWVPLGDRDTGVGSENATCYPSPGELLLFPGGVSEAEILFPYGPTAFASKAGALAGNHFATIVSGWEHLAEIGRRLLWNGAQGIEIVLAGGEDESARP